ncbi:MAG TPA: EamA family transporter, partial [Rhizobiales bacterium]|nr:EamA family transporter [Hyphomicrobiales bacterium]
MPLDRTGVMLGIIGAAMFSTKPILIKFIYEYGVDTSTLMALRMAFSLPFYLGFAVIAYRQRRRDHITTDYSARTLVITAIIGVFGYYVASFLDLEGLTRITAQFERLILFTYPVFVAILSAFFLDIKFTRPTLVSLALTYTGLFVIFSHDMRSFGDQVLSGALMVLAAAAVFAGYVVFSKDLIDKLGSRLFTCF